MYQQTLVTDIEKNQASGNDRPTPRENMVLAASPCSKRKQTKQSASCRQCSIKIQRRVTNSNLLTGPDLLNRLIGILVRFREEPIAILADI